MTATAIRQKLCDYIRVAEDRKVKAIYTMLEEEIEEAYNYWNDKEFVAELDKRTAEYESGKVKGITLKELESGARQSYKNSKQKNK